MTARVGAVHLGWDVVSVAAGGGGSPIRPVLVEGSYTPPAYLLADSSGRLHTAGVDRRPDVGIAISDVRDIIGHPQIVVAGATWPAELVFRARMHNPLASVVEHLGTTPDVLALPFPDEWPDPKVDEFVRLVEQLGVPAEPLPESVALSGYVRALGLVRAPGRGPAVGAVGVYSDGRECLVVAVHGNDDQPTESVSVAITAEALHEAHAADNVVIEVMAAARAINADTSTVLLTGNVCFNDALRLAFQNHLGHRFQVADHPMHALVLGATHLLVADSEGDPAYDRPRPAAGQQAGSAQQAGTAGQQAGPPQQAGAVGQQSGSEQQPGGADGQPIEQGPRHVSGGPADRPLQRQPEPLAQQPELVPRHMDSPPAPESATQRPGSAPRTGPQPAADAGKPAGGDSEGRTRRLTAEEAAAVAALTKGSTSGQPADPAAEGLTRRITAQDAAAQGSATGNTGPGGITQRVTAAELARLTQTGAGEPDRNAAAAAGTSPSGDAGQGVTRSAEGPGAGGQPVAGGRGTLPPGLEGVGGRFMRPPGSPADDQMTTVFGPGDQGGPGSGHQGGAGSGRQGYAASTHAADGGYGSGTAGAQQGSGSAGTYGPSGQGGYGQGQPGGAFGPGGQVQGGYGQPGAYGPGESQAAAGQFGPGTGGPGSTGGSGYGTGYGSANAAGSEGSAQGGYGPGGAQQGPGGQYGSQQGPGGQYNQGGYGPGGYGAQGGYTTGGYPAGPYGPEGDTSGSGRGSFAGSGGNAPGQPGAMYGGPMSSGVRGSNPQAPEDAAGQSDSDSGSGSEGERKPRKGKLWGKMRKPFGAPIVVGAAALSLLGAHSDQRATVAAESVPPASSMTSTASGTASGTSVAPGTASGVVARATVGEVRPVGDSCAMTPFVSGLPGSGVATIGDPQSLECLRLGIDTLRYTLPGPVRGIDPGPPLHI
ncbi:hypothetical protein [Nocardia tengchongensis]|uniref:hypothetical protein n=1 Tax=Nocardia tengchongensis TaxID=2055889 RepID=UPI00369F69F2